ncbi:hypothetical protein STAR110904_04635 [Staphylococcus argensis]
MNISVFTFLLFKSVTLSYFIMHGGGIGYKFF